ncbi:unnamed protein product [Amoebophrya sp. A25]|nr:unnamed protein product [Amoebophrya sp. A25]|eukprot:GSA25T00021972001.1
MPGELVLGEFQAPAEEQIEKKALQDEVAVYLEAQKRYLVFTRDGIFQRATAEAPLEPCTKGNIATLAQMGARAMRLQEQKVDKELNEVEKKLLEAGGGAERKAGGGGLEERVAAERRRIALKFLVLRHAKIQFRSRQNLGDIAASEGVAKSPDEGVIGEEAGKEEIDKDIDQQADDLHLDNRNAALIAGNEDATSSTAGGSRSDQQARTIATNTASTTSASSSSRGTGGLFKRGNNMFKQQMLSSSLLQNLKRGVAEVKQGTDEIVRQRHLEQDYLVDVEVPPSSVQCNSHEQDHGVKNPATSSLRAAASSSRSTRAVETRTTASIPAGAPKAKKRSAAPKRKLQVIDRRDGLKDVFEGLNTASATSSSSCSSASANNFKYGQGQQKTKRRKVNDDDKTDLNVEQGGKKRELLAKNKRAGAPFSSEDSEDQEMSVEYEEGENAEDEDDDYGPEEFFSQAPAAPAFIPQTTKAKSSSRGALNPAPPLPFEDDDDFLCDSDKDAPPPAASRGATSSRPNLVNLYKNKNKAAAAVSSSTTTSTTTLFGSTSLENAGPLQIDWNAPTSVAPQEKPKKNQAPSPDENPKMENMMAQMLFDSSDED